MYPASSTPGLLEYWEVSTSTTGADTVCFQYNHLLYQLRAVYRSTPVLSTTKAAKAGEGRALPPLKLVGFTPCLCKRTTHALAAPQRFFAVAFDDGLGHFLQCPSKANRGGITHESSCLRRLRTTGCASACRGRNTDSQGQCRSQLCLQVVAASDSEIQRGTRSASFSAPNSRHSGFRRWCAPRHSSSAILSLRGTSRRSVAKRRYSRTSS